jgi:hypothetical protein
MSVRGRVSENHIHWSCPIHEVRTKAITALKTRPYTESKELIETLKGHCGSG